MNTSFSPLSTRPQAHLVLDVLDGREGVLVAGAAEAETPVLAHAAAQHLARGRQGVLLRKENRRGKREEREGASAGAEGSKRAVRLMRKSGRVSGWRKRERAWQSAVSE